MATDQWEVCLEHQSGVNWHTPHHPPEGKCDARILLGYPEQRTNVAPCRIVKIDAPEDDWLIV